MSKSIIKDWEEYCKKIEEFSELDSISEEWSIYNKKVESLCEKNQFLKAITIEWYQGFNKNESIDLTKLLDKMCQNWFYKCYSTMDVLMKIENDEVLLFQEYKEEFSKSFKSEIEVKEKFIELITFYFDKNPKFKFDW